MSLGLEWAFSPTFHLVEGLAPNLGLALESHGESMHPGAGHCQQILQPSQLSSGVVTCRVPSPSGLLLVLDSPLFCTYIRRVGFKNE